jgi:RND family efflux transporter MFP subunit
MKRIGQIILLLVLLGVAGAGGYWYGRHHDADEKPEAAPTTQAAEEEKPVVAVGTMSLKRGRIAETVVVYGTVVAQAGEVRAVSVPFESRVARVLVTPGEAVAAGTEVAEVEASPDALTALQEARSTLEAAQRDLKQTQERLADRLATKQELSQAQQAMAAAQLKLDSLVRRGIGQAHRLKAERAGIVSKVDVQEGQIVPAGGALVELASSERIEVRLGVEPSDAAWLKPGQAVRLSRVDRSAGEPIEGRVRMIEQRVDPATRLAAAIVSLPPDARLMLDSFVTGEFTSASADALVVPRDAALPDDDGKYVLYTVKDGHAVRHVVQIGLESGQEVQVIADDLKEGLPVVVMGNYLLSDGMAVEVKEDKP